MFFVGLLCNQYTTHNPQAHSAKLLLNEAFVLCGGKHTNLVLRRYEKRVRRNERHK